MSDTLSYWVLVKFLQALFFLFVVSSVSAGAVYLREHVRTVQLLRDIGRTVFVTTHFLWREGGHCNANSRTNHNCLFGWTDAARIGVLRNFSRNVIHWTRIMLVHHTVLPWAQMGQIRILISEVIAHIPLMDRRVVELHMRVSIERLCVGLGELTRLRWLWHSNVVIVHLHHPQNFRETLSILSNAFVWLSERKFIPREVVCLHSEQVNNALLTRGTLHRPKWLSRKHSILLRCFLAVVRCHQQVIQILAILLKVEDLLPRLVFVSKLVLECCQQFVDPVKKTRLKVG